MNKQTQSLNQVLKIAKLYGYTTVENSIGERFTLEEFYTHEGNIRSCLLYANLPGKRGKIIKYIRGGHYFRSFDLLEG